MTDEISRHRGELEEATSRAEELLNGLDDEALNWRPAPRQWSIGQCIDHLNRTAQPYLRELPGVIANARENEIWGSHAPKRGWLGRVFLFTLEPPPKLRVKAPKAFLPANALKLEELQGEHRRLREELRGVIGSAEGLDLWKVRMPLPTVRAVRLSLGEVFAVLLAHERRHLWQAERIRALPQFPLPPE